MYLGIYEGERRVVCDLCHILRFWVLERGLVITGDQVAVNYAENVMGVTEQQTDKRNTRYRSTEAIHNSVYRYIARVPLRWSILTRAARWS